MDYIPVPKAGKLFKGKTDIFRPFRGASSNSGENIVPLYDPSLPRHDAEEPDLRDLNNCLRALVDIFPDVQPEVFREMLLSVEPESRLQIVTENLLKKKAQWVQGRYRTPERASGTKKPVTGKDDGVLRLATEESFRSEAYKKAVRTVLYQEFKTLSHSAIKGVLAEQNYSYTYARPTLQHLASRSWRFSFTSLWLRRSLSSSMTEHPNIVWTSDNNDVSTSPRLKKTGSPQLDHELYELFLAPIVNRTRQDRLVADHALAHELNAAQAEEANALYDCECCYNAVSFEQLAACDETCHYLCLECVRRTTKEALYGQGWARSVGLEKESLRCFAPTAAECHGCVPSSFVRRALEDGSDTEDIWIELQDRIASDVLMKSRLPLHRCPFCNYAEAEIVSTTSIKSPSQLWRYFNSRNPYRLRVTVFVLSIITFFFTAPALLAFGLLWSASFIMPSASAQLQASYARVRKKRRGLQFRCQSPRCAKKSCMRCNSIWRDPHICFENEQTSLRTAIEASATAAIKRTCPKCMLSFVKSSGCNKLVCNCGYTMCYVCRQEITSMEGYAHFCQHFRPMGGRCTECERCDLYGDEDEEVAIRRAAEDAEKVWRAKERGEVSGDDNDDLTTKLMVEAFIGQGRKVRWWENGLDAFTNAILE